MQADTITLKEMLDSMDKGERFKIGFRTYDYRKDEGGEWIEFDNCVKHNHQLKSHTSTTTSSKKSSKRNPNHFDNSTRNIKRLDNGNLFKVHIRLIRKFNDKSVI